MHFVNVVIVSFILFLCGYVYYRNCSLLTEENCDAMPPVGRIYVDFTMLILPAISNTRNIH
jgi:hypothetical protein